MRSSNDFLTAYGESLLKWVRKPIPFAALKRRFESPRFHVSVPYDFQEALAELKAAKTILDKITTIVYHPHIHATTQEIIVRSELARHLSNQDFKETVKDAKLWRRKGAGMAPEYVHAQEHVDTLATYENAFIAYLLDLIEGDIEGILADIAPLVEPLEQRYEAKGLVYGERSFLRDLQGGGKPMKRSFLFESHSSQEVLALSRALRKRVKNIKSTEFYRFNAVLPAEKAVAPTNILVHDPLYGACYRHYLDRYVHGSANAKKEGSAHYYNYVVSLFLLHLKNDLPPDLLLSVDGGKIRFGSFSVKRGNYLLSFFDSPAENVIEIEATLSLRRSVSSKARYRLLIEKALSDATRPGLEERLERPGADRSALICQANTTGRYRDVLNLSIYRDDSFVALENLFASMTLLFECEPGVYESLCPVCGSKRPSIDGDDYRCPACDCRYALLRKGKTALVWMKTLRRNER